MNRTSDNSFGLAMLGAGYNGTTTPSIQNEHNQFPMLDAAISGFRDNETFAVELWEDNGTPSNLADDTLLASYSNLVGKRPYLNSELSAGLFPTITTAPSAISAFATAGGNLTVAWTLPTGLKVTEAHFWRSGASYHYSYDLDVAATATSTTLTIGAPTFTVKHSGINLYVEDVFNREMTTILNGQ